MSRRPSAAARSLEASATVFAALGDETRLRLVARLGQDGPASITGLTEGAAVTRQAVTKHLYTMKAAGLVRVTRQGRESVWELEPRGLDDAHRYLEIVSKQWDAALGRLKAFVER